MGKDAYFIHYFYTEKGVIFDHFSTLFNHA